MTRALVSLLLIALSTVGCSVDPPGPPGRGTTSPPPSTGAAPSVTNPLSTSGFSARPCTLLEAGELAQLGMTGPGRQRQTLGAQACRWNSRSSEDLGLTPDDGRNLLEDAYRAPWRGVSTPGNLSGYPTLRRKTGSGDLNICTVIVGLGPDSSLTADWVGTGAPGGERDACTMAEQAAARAIRKLPPAG